MLIVHLLLLSLVGNSLCIGLINSVILIFTLPKVPHKFSDYPKRIKLGISSYDGEEAENSCGALYRS